jgi:hypothetical protein
MRCHHFQTGETSAHGSNLSHCEGRKLQAKIENTRQSVLDLARGLIGEHDVEPTLDLFNEMLEHTPYKELIDRRRELFGISTG